MKRKLLLIALLIPTVFVNAQTKNIELNNLVRMLAQDSISTTQYVAWNKGQSIADVSFEAKPQYNTITKKYSVEGKAKITINGKIVKCDNNACGWYVNLEGNQVGYNKFTINNDLSQNSDIKISTDYLFGKNEIKVKPLKICDNGEGFYELKIKGKKPLWMSTMNTFGEEGSSLYLFFFLNKADMEISCL